MLHEKIKLPSKASQLQLHRTVGSSRYRALQTICTYSNTPVCDAASNYHIIIWSPFRCEPPVKLTKKPSHNGIPFVQSCDHPPRLIIAIVGFSYFSCRVLRTYAYVMISNKRGLLPLAIQRSEAGFIIRALELMFGDLDFILWSGLCKVLATLEASKQLTNATHFPIFWRHIIYGAFSNVGESLFFLQKSV